MRTTATIVVQVFGDIRQLRKIAEGAHHRQGFGGRERVQHLFQLIAVAVILRFSKAHRSAAHVLHQLEGFVALLFAQGVAENAPQQANIVTQGYVFAGKVNRSGKQIHGI
jgi:hypothetical protein